MRWLSKDGVMIRMECRLYRDGNTIAGEADQTWGTQYWYALLLWNSILLDAAGEVRKKLTRLDLSHYADDGA